MADLCFTTFARMSFIDIPFVFHLFLLEKLGASGGSICVYRASNFAYRSMQRISYGICPECIRVSLSQNTTLS